MCSIFHVTEYTHASVSLCSADQRLYFYCFARLRLKVADNIWGLTEQFQALRFSARVHVTVPGQNFPQFHFSRLIVKLFLSGFLHICTETCLWQSVAVLWVAQAGTNMFYETLRCFAFGCFVKVDLNFKNKTKRFFSSLSVKKRNCENFNFVLLEPPSSAAFLF